MYIILEHNGTSGAMDVAGPIEDMLLENGHNVDQIVSTTNVITLYNEDRQIMANFDRVPDEALLKFYVELGNNEPI